MLTLDQIVVIIHLIYFWRDMLNLLTDVHTCTSESDPDVGSNRSHRSSHLFLNPIDSVNRWYYSHTMSIKVNYLLMVFFSSRWWIRKGNIKMKLIAGLRFFRQVSEIGYCESTISDDILFWCASKWSKAILNYFRPSQSHVWISCCKTIIELIGWCVKYCLWSPFCSLKVLNVDFLYLQLHAGTFWWCCILCSAHWQWPCDTSQPTPSSLQQRSVQRVYVCLMLYSI